jgi:hypothetical protein
MRLEPRPELKQLTALECAVCGGLMCTPAQADAALAVALFGAVPYAVCPACCREVGPKLESDEEYRRRARLAYLRRGLVVRQTARGCELVSVSGREGA